MKLLFTLLLLKLFLTYPVKANDLEANDCPINLSPFDSRSLPCLPTKDHQIIKSGNTNDILALYDRYKKHFIETYKPPNFMHPRNVLGKRPSNQPKVDRLAQYYRFQVQQLIRRPYGNSRLHQESLLNHMNVMLNAIWYGGIQNNTVLFIKLMEHNFRDFNEKLTIVIERFAVKIYLFFKRDKAVIQYMKSKRDAFSFLVRNPELLSLMVEKNISLNVKDKSFFKPEGIYKLLTMSHSQTSAAVTAYSSRIRNRASFTQKSWNGLISYLINNGMDLFYVENGHNVIDLLIENRRFRRLFELLSKGLLKPDYYTTSGLYVGTAFLDRDKNRYLIVAKAKYGIRADVLYDKKNKLNLKAFAWNKGYYGLLLDLNNYTFTPYSQSIETQNITPANLYWLKNLFKKFVEKGRSRKDLLLYDPVLSEILNLYKKLYNDPELKKHISYHSATPPDKKEFKEYLEEKNKILKHRKRLAKLPYKYSSKGKNALKGEPPVMNGLEAGVWVNQVKNTKNKKYSTKISHLLCLDDAFYPLDIFKIIGFDIKEETRSGGIPFKSYDFRTNSSLKNGKLKCAMAINLDDNRYFKHPFEYAKRSVPLARSWSDVKNESILSEDAQIMTITFKGKSYLIKRDFQKKAFFLTTDSGKEITKLYDFFCNPKRQNAPYACYPFVRLINAGDFNGDGKLDLFTDPNNDNHHAKEVLLSKPDSTDYERIKLDFTSC